MAVLVLWPALAWGFPAGSERRITSDPGDQSNPRISGQHIVYTDDRHGQLEIYLYDLENDTETRITTDPGAQIQPDVASGHVVFTSALLQSGVPNVEILLYEIATGTTSSVSGHPADQRAAAIGGGANGLIVAWQDERDRMPGREDEGANVYLRRVSTGGFEQVTEARSDEWLPAVAQNRVAYERFSGGNSDIGLFDVASGRSVPIVEHPATQSDPDLDGDYVVWQDDRKGDFDIYLLDLDEGIPRQITRDSADQLRPSVSGSLLVWDDARSGSWDVWAQDLATGVAFQVTSGPADQQAAHVDGLRIVYQDSRDGQLDIYLYEFPTPLEVSLLPPGARAAAVGLMLGALLAALARRERITRSRRLP